MVLLNALGIAVTKLDTDPAVEEFPLWWGTLSVKAERVAGDLAG